MRMVLFSYEPLATSGLPQPDELIATADVTCGGLCLPSHR
jgi:hypothetical protein